MNQAGGKINSLTDLAMWGKSDEDIIGACAWFSLSALYSLVDYLGAAVASWKSKVYDHYGVTLKRNVDELTGEPESMDFVFTCKSHPEFHPGPRVRGRSKTGDGTTNLRTDVDVCLKKQGIEAPKASSSYVKVPPYSEKVHCALIATRCAKHARPINTVLDDDYLAEVEMLRPGTKVPHLSTVQRDLMNIYECTSTYVCNYFAVSQFLGQ